MIGPVDIRLHEGFPGSCRLAPGSPDWVRPGGVVSWPLADFKANFDCVAKGQYTVVKSTASTPALLPDVQPDDEDHATPAWLSGYPAGDWRDIVKVAKSFGFTGKKRADAESFLSGGVDGPIGQDGFEDRLAALRADES